MPQKPRSLRLARAIGIALVRTPAGRRVLGAVVVASAAGSLLVGETTSCEHAKHDGRWSGLKNQIAPRSGSIVIDGAAGRDATCTVRGKAGHVSGDQWVFRGEALVEETSCKGRIARRGDVTISLELKMEYRGRLKGQGGDWEDVDGKALCAGDLTGSLTRGGTWQARCRDGEQDWEATFDWEPS